MKNDKLFISGQKTQGPFANSTFLTEKKPKRAAPWNYYLMKLIPVAQLLSLVGLVQKSLQKKFRT